MAQSVPDGIAGAVRRVAAGRLDARRRRRSAAGARAFWLDSDRAGEHAVEVTLRPARLCVGDCDRGAERRGRHAPLRAAGPAAAHGCAARGPTCSPAGASRTGSSSDVGETAALLFDVDTALGVPAAPRRWSPRSTAHRTAPLRRRAPPCPGGDVMVTACSPVSVVGVVLRVVAGRSRSPWSRRRRRCGCSASGAGGAPRCSLPADRLGRRRVCSLSARPTGTGVPTASCSTCSPSRSRRRWPWPSTLDLLARPGSLATASAPAW